MRVGLDAEVAFLPVAHERPVEFAQPFPRLVAEGGQNGVSVLGLQGNKARGVVLKAASYAHGRGEGIRVVALHQICDQRADIIGRDGDAVDTDHSRHDTRRLA
jgi:hypothetical protein